MIKWNKYDIGEVNKASISELRAVVRKAAKVANQRLRELEKTGYTKGVYKRTINNLKSTGKTRFREGVKTASLSELRSQYVWLRDFLQAKTSTVRGYKAADRKRYETAVERGFTGTQDEFELLSEKYLQGELEKRYDSNTIYSMILEGKTDIIDEVITDDDGIRRARTEGELLLAFINRR